MLNKTIIAFSAIALLGSVSVASAEVIENQIGDKYQFLAQGWQANAVKIASKPVAYEVVENRIGDRFPTLEPTAARRVTGLRHATARVAYDVPENRIGDRYPTLERTATMHRGMSVAMHRMGKKV